jgi:23S rRNA pseudouridine1911/1915/1917 synthase
MDPVNHTQDPQFVVIEAETGRRLDQVVSERVAALSRSYAARLIKDGRVCVEGTRRKQGYRVTAGETITYTIPAPEAVSTLAEPVEIDFLYEDSHIVVINKRPGQVVHPSPGHTGGTIVNGLLYHCPDIAGIGGEVRPGIVHRLDKDTSGVLVVAKNQIAHERLADQFKKRTLRKRYLALLKGVLPADSGVVDLPIGRHPVDRKKMSVKSRRGRNALTRWKIRERLVGASLVEVDLHTGRTHQIRVHMTAMGHPVVGDAVYGRPRGEGVHRQMLHAWKIRLVHPATLQTVSFEAPLPADMAAVIETYREAAQEAPKRK